MLEITDSVGNTSLYRQGPVTLVEIWHIIKDQPEKDQPAKVKPGNSSSRNSRTRIRSTKK